MTPADLAALERGCCTRRQAAESGCRLCVERYAAIDRVRADVERLRRALGAALAVWCPRGDPGGDGADGETWAMGRAALGLPR